MLGQVGNLLALGIVAVLLCSAPVWRSTPAAPMHSHSDGHNHGAASGDHQHADQHDMPMQMVFEYGYRTTLWFSSLQTDTPASYFAILLGLGLLAFVHEGLAAYRRSRSSPDEQLDLLREPKLASGAGGGGGGGSLALGFANLSTERLVQSGLHAASLGLSYLLMLAVMSMNFGVFMAVLVGFGAGFYAFHGERFMLAQPLVRSDACHGL